MNEPKKKRFAYSLETLAGNILGGLATNFLSTCSGMGYRVSYQNYNNIFSCFFLFLFVCLFVCFWSSMARSLLYYLEIGRNYCRDHVGKQV